MASGCTTQLAGIVVIAAAAHHIVRARGRSLRVDGIRSGLLVGILGIPVLTILHHVAQHVAQSEWIGSHTRRFLRAVLAVEGVYGVAIDGRRVCAEDAVPKAFARVGRGLAFEEVRRVRAATSCVLPFGFRWQTIVPAGLQAEPLAESLSRIMRHRDGRTVSHAPALVGHAEWWGRAGHRIHIRTAVVGIDDLRLRASLRHCLDIECPVLIPRHLDLSHKEWRDGDLVSRVFIGTAELVALLATHRELASWHSNHVDGGAGARNRLREVRETCYCSRFRIDRPSRVDRRRRHLLVLVASDEMSGIEMARDTLQAQFLLVLFVIEMCSDAIVGDAFREEIGVALLAGAVEDDAGRIFLGPLRLEVEVLLVVGEVHPNVVQANLDLCPIVMGCASWGKMACSTVRLHTALVHEVLALLPACLSLGMHMTSPARLVRRGDIARIECSQHQHDAEQSAAQSSEEVFLASRHF